MARTVIGILAYNEAEGIGQALRGLIGQSVFPPAGAGGRGRGQEGAAEVAVYVVANGCRDATAAVARATLAELAEGRGFTWQVAEVAEAGKANAWNVLIHELLPAEARQVVLMDADIGFPGPGTIAAGLQALEADPGLKVAASRPVKHFAGGGGWLVRALAGSGGIGPTGISGQLYCARAEVLRGIVMPKGIIVEDGYLRAMIVTSWLTEPERAGRIANPPGFSHLYAPYTGLRALARYEKRQAMGTAINALVYADLQKLPPAPVARRREILRRNAEEPGWVQRLVALRCAGGGRVVPRSYAYRRLRAFRGRRGLALLKAALLPPALLFDLWTARQARATLAAGSRQTFWDKIRS